MSWSSLYSDHQSVSVTIRFIHLTGLLLGGGTALFADRRILRAAKGGPEQRKASLAALDGVHRHVIFWLSVVGFTGVLMAGADTATFLASRLFWIKMALVGLLAANGAAMLAVERRVRAGAGWPRLVAVSALSGALWIAVLFLGTLLTVAA